MPPDESPLGGHGTSSARRPGSRPRPGEIGRFQLSNSVTDEAGVLFLATDLAEGRPAPDATEDLTVRRVPFDEALTMTPDGRITDAIAIMGIQRVGLDRGSASG